MKSQILKLRKKIYQNLKAKASSYETRSKELISYYADQEKFSKRSFTECSIRSVKDRVLESDLFFIGDFHTFDQNIRNVLRIMKVILSEENECILALEMIDSEYQLQLDAYMEGHLTDLEFLESINYHNSWRFPWTHYKLIFELAKEHNIKVIALNTKGSLSKRDKHSSEIIANYSIENPESKILVLYGELHITKNKMPAILKKSCPNLKQVIIHQNLDEVYWKLVKTGKEQGLVSFSDDEYCIISAPPWVKYESMIYWYENLCDDPEFDIHEYIIEKGKKIFSEDTSENFYAICEDIVSHLNLEIDEDYLEDFNLYDHTNLAFIEKKLELNLKPSLISFYQYLIETNRSFRLPSNATFYCSSYSMNRISYLAGIHIFHLFNTQSLTPVDVLNSKSKQNKFFLFVFENMFGYFFSKIINPHRKCEMYKDIYSMKDKIEFKNQAHILEAALKSLDDKSISQSLRGLSLKDVYETSLFVGHILGEYMYINYTKNNFLTKDFKLNLSSQHFCRLRQKLLSAHNYKKDSKRYF